MAKKNQSKILTNQHKKSEGVVGIFGNEAKLHDITVGKISHLVIEQNGMAKKCLMLWLRFQKPLLKY